MQLSLEERLILRNQYRMLERLDPEAKDECRYAIKVLEGGYEYQYFTLEFGEPMSKDECREVMDILEMFRELQVSYEHLVDKAGLDAGAISFRGFDGNEEPKELRYAQFLVHDDERFEELSEAGDHLNSHASFMPRYRRMVAVWRECAGQPESTARMVFGLTSDEIKRISEA